VPVLFSPEDSRLTVLGDVSSSVKMGCFPMFVCSLAKKPPSSRECFFFAYNKWLARRLISGPFYDPPSAPRPPFGCFWVVGGLSGGFSAVL